MMLYRYRAIDEQGKIAQGRLEAANLADLEQRLARIGLTLIRAKSGQIIRANAGKIHRRDLITFCFHMEQLSRAGVPLLDGLLDLRDSIEHPRFREVIASLVEAIEGGSSFSQALAAHPAVFDSVFVSLIHAGETSGELPQVLKRLTETLKWQDELAAQTRKILLYPAFVGLLVLGVLAFVMIYLVPRLVEFIQGMGQTLPLNTRILLAVSDFFIHHGWILIALPLCSLLLVKLRLVASPAFRRQFDGWKLRLPLLGPILHKIILVRLANVFALLFAAGIPVLDCLQIAVGITGNARIAEALDRLTQRISEGMSISASFEEAQLFPPLVLRMLRVGENTGALDTALLNVAYFYDRDVKESIARVQILIEPALTVALGLMLAWIMSSVLGPIFDTLGKIR
ncbi:MAG: type secretion system family protein [Proteobacteria bacterium]|nr:type secretion system family protein [Pseudomonadota bacterium]